MADDPINMKQDDNRQTGAKVSGNTGTGSSSGSGIAGNTGTTSSASASNQISTAKSPSLDYANNPDIPEKIRQYWKDVEAKYVIPKVVRQKYANLIPLIKETESMNDDEREYWFQILPIMTDDQLKKFRGILQNEKNQLEKLDNEYDSELAKLNDKHLSEWRQFESKEKREKLRKAEEAYEVKEDQQEEALLSKLDEL